MNIGTNWLKKNSSLLLDIPSAVVDKEINTLNPLHPDIKYINVKAIEKFSFGPRLYRIEKHHEVNEELVGQVAGRNPTTVL